MVLKTVMFTITKTFPHDPPFAEKYCGKSGIVDVKVKKPKEWKREK